MSIPNPIEHMSFFDSDEKPSLDLVGVYLDRRLEDTKSSQNGAGISVAKDSFGNTVYTSSNKEEATFAGKVPATLMASEGGKELVRLNPELLRNIQHGDLPPILPTMGGLESRVYKIALETGTGISEFALKYCFPVETNESYHHTSGVIAMRLMQLAQQEQPIHSIHYVVPLLASHDVTLAPFTFDGVPTTDVMELLRFPEDVTEIELLDDYGISGDNAKLLLEMIKCEPEIEKVFCGACQKVIADQTKVLSRWVKRQIATNPELASFAYNNLDTHLSQSVISIPTLYKAFVNFRNNMESGSSSSFASNFLDSIALVELGAGLKQK